MRESPLFSLGRPLPESLGKSHILAALRQLPGAFYLRDDEREFAGAWPSAESTELDPEPGLVLPGSTDDAQRSWPRWVGFLPYEAFRALERASSPDRRPVAAFEKPSWRRFDAIVEWREGKSAVVRGSDQGAVARLAMALESPARGLTPESANLRWSAAPEPSSLHEARIRAALEQIARGELYQVNLARRFGFRVSGHPFELLLRLGGWQASPFAAALDWGERAVVSTSPESFLRVLPSGVLQTRPIKGTRPRQPEADADQRQRIELERSEKERAELAMVIDLERNDFGRLAVPGGVRLAAAPYVVSLGTVHHREALVEATLRRDVTRRDILEKTMPSGSVTGAPKVRAMDLIRSLEAERRGLYTGAFGYVATGGSLHLSMAIRCLFIAGQEASYYSGGGIVADSDPALEVQETIWKSRQLAGLLGADAFAELVRA